MPRFFAIALGCLWMVSTGCHLWPFQRQVRTSYMTPAKRIAAVEAIGERALDADAGQQQVDAVELARQIQTEPDPLVREAVLRNIAPLQVPMAERVLVAALQDDDPYVRQMACRLLGERRDPAAIMALKKTLQTDEDTDVRVAATKALGELGCQEAIPAIAIALYDSDPGLQYVGTQAMQLVSNERLGNEVEAWRAFAKRYTANDPAAPALADQQVPPANFQ